MSLIKVGILRGGNNENYEKSLQEGGELFSYINTNLADKYKAIDIMIDKNNVWHVKGLPILPSTLMHNVDLVWNMSHSLYAQTLKDFSIPHVSTEAFSGALLESKAMLREHMNNTGVSMPNHFIIPVYQEDFDGDIEKFAIKKAKEIFEKFGSPWIVKSLVSNGMGIHVAKTYPELVNAIIDGAEHGGSIIIEELIAGKEIETHVLKNFRDENLYVFPFRGVSKEEKEKLMNVIYDIHQETGNNSYMYAKFIITPNKGLYLNGISFLPSINDNSNLIEACESVGTKTHHIIEHILKGVL